MLINIWQSIFDWLQVLSPYFTFCAAICLIAYLLLQRKPRLILVILLAMTVSFILFLAAALIYSFVKGKPEWVTAMGALLMIPATLFLAFVAIYQEKLKEWIAKPKLKIEIVLAPPDCQAVPIKPQRYTCLINSHFVRARIWNRGTLPAREIELSVDYLQRIGEDGKRKDINNFLPMNLTWSHTGNIYCPRISSKTWKHCDVFHIIEPGHRHMLPHETSDPESDAGEPTMLSFDFPVKPFTGSHLVRKGKYELRLMAAASNAEPVFARFEIYLSGAFYATEEEMFKNGLTIRELTGDS